MAYAVDIVVYAVILGAGATAATDIWALMRRKLQGVPLPDWALVGRWIAYLPRGRFIHKPIAASPPIAHERLIGWTAHYVIGMGFALLLLMIWGPAWAHHPTPGPALIIGLGSVAAPFLLMQPGMGAGIAARRTPKPNVARLRSLVTHAVFALGLYATAIIVRSVGDGVMNAGF